MTMNRVLFILISLCFFYSFSQKTPTAFQRGEFLQYKVHYGLMNAGLISVEVHPKTSETDTLFRATGRGWTTGMVGFVFPVEDIYKTSFGENSFRPVHFVRKINEGGYTKDKEIFFDFKKHQARVVNHKKSTEESYFIQNNIQDMLSSFYYLRKLDLSMVKENDTITIPMFFDEEMYHINLLILGREVLKTDFGKIKTLRVRPIVQEGRVFKDKENVTLWLSDDQNKIPLRIKASILVGSVKADLVEYRGLVHPFP